MCYVRLLSVLTLKSMEEISPGTPFKNYIYICPDILSQILILQMSAMRGKKGLVCHEMYII